MTNAQFIIRQEGGDIIWYVQQSPVIQFTANREDALPMSQNQVLDTLTILMTMQRISSGSDAPIFAVECVRKGAIS